MGSSKRFSATFLVLAVCLVIGFLPSVSAFDWNTGIVSYYKLDETSGTVIDIAGTNNGTNNGATPNIAGKINTSYDFEKLESDYITTNTGSGVGEDLDFTENFSISTWIKIESLISAGSNIIIVGKRGGVGYQYVFRVTADEKLQLLTSGGTVGDSTGQVLAVDTWYHVVVTYDADGDTIFYVNGSVDYSDSSLSIDHKATDVYIGGQESLDSYFDGLIDEVGFWDKVLTPTEVTDLYNSGDGLPYDGGIKKPIITLSPSNETTISDIGTNFTTNFTVSELDYVWKNATYYVWKNGDLFNTTTVTLSGNETNSSQFIDSFTLADYKWNVYGCYGNSTYDNCTWADSNFTFTVGATINSETYDNVTYETAEDTFEVNITLLSGVILQAAYLYYNDIRYIGTIIDLGSNQYSMIKTLSVPLINGGAENNSFYWSFVYTSPVQKTQNTTTLNQTVSPIYFVPCNATYTTHALDILIKEEGNFDSLNGTLEFSADYWLGDGTVKKELTYSYLENDTNSYDFCISPTDKTFMIDDIISFTSEGYERRDYFLTNAELSNATMNLSLYLALTESTDVFTVTVQDENSKPIESSFINVQRWDIGTNNFYTVGVIKTTSDGTGIINMRLNDAWYRFQVYYEDILYLTTEPRKEAGTSRTLDINLAESNPYDQFGDIDYSLTYDETTNVSVFTYADTTGSVATGCLKVLKMEGNGTTQVYYSCVQSSSGTLSYEIEDDGTYIIRAIFRLSDTYDNVEQVVDEIIRQGTGARFKVIDQFGQVISLFLVGTSAMLGIAIGSIPLGLGLIATALVLVNLLGWLNITSSVLYGLISIIILIAINLRRGR